MIVHVIYPKDSSTEFLLEIPKAIIGAVGTEKINLIMIEASIDSYNQGKDSIQSIEEKDIVLFMGHGQYDMLFGAESPTFPKEPFIKKTEIRLFENKYLFSLSCYSNELLRTTFSYSKILSSVGFGSLPTEMIEVESNKRLKDQGVNIRIIESYKQILVELVSKSFIYLISSECDFLKMTNYFLLLLNKKISEVILNDKKDKDFRILADLLFQMRSELIFI